MPFVNINGTRIHYTHHGEGPAVVFLAGSSLGTSFWRWVMEKMPGEYRRIAVDVRGSGQSDAPRGAYSIAEMAGEVVGVLDHLGIYEARLVGHSMGGFVALGVTRSQPERVKGLLLVATGPSGRPSELKTTPAAIHALGRTSGSIEEIFRALLKIGIGSKLRSEMPSAIEQLVSAHLKHPPRGMGFVGQRAAIGSFEARNFLADIGCPTTVIHGTEDQIILPANGEQLATQLPNAQFVSLDGVGHFPPVESPDRLASAILQITRQTSSQPD